MPVWTPAGLKGYGLPNVCDESASWPGTEELTYRCAYILWGGLLLLFITHFIIRAILRTHWTSFTLSEMSIKAGVTREANLCDATREIQSIILSSVLGPAGAYLTWRSFSLFDNPALDTILLHPESSAESCDMVLYVCTLGATFGAWSLYQFSWLLLGWQSGLENYVHHTVFSLVSFLNPYNFVLIEATLAALAMEISSPALSTMLIFRQVRGSIKTPLGLLEYSQIETVAALVFMPLFLIARVFVFGYAMWRCMQVWVLQPPLVMTALGDGSYSAEVLCIQQALYLGGFGLQLFWAQLIVSKFMRKFGKSDPKKRS